MPPRVDEFEVGWYVEVGYGPLLVVVLMLVMMTGG